MKENILGVKLCKRRDKLGKTQERAALALETSAKIKVSQPTINNWEKVNLFLPFYNFGHWPKYSTSNFLIFYQI